MNTLFETIFEMPGPYFLAFYTMLILAAHLVLYYLRDKVTDSDHYVEVPAEPSPYITSFICNGASDTVKLVVYNLIERGYLRLSEDKSAIMRTQKPPNPKNLGTVERIMFNHFTSAKQLKDILPEKPQKIKFIDKLKSDPFLKKNKQLIVSKEKLETYKLLKFILISIVWVLGAIKLLAAWNNGHTNVWFLIILIVIGVISLVVRKGSAYTKCRDRYVEDLKKVFESKMNLGPANCTPYYQFMLAAVYGTAILHNCGYSFLAKISGSRIGYSNSGGSSCSGCMTSCGSSCGSSSSGSCGSSCGSGCGGCGGD